MNKRVSLIVLCVVAFGVISAHVSLAHKENGYLLVIDEREIDIVGEFHNDWVRSTRRCDDVLRLSDKDQLYLDVEKTIKAYSPPNSEAAQIASVWTTGVWTLAEVEFKELLPAVVLIKHTDTISAIVPNAVWSGYTKPWKAAPYIREYLSKQSRETPASLFECFEPQSNAFRQ
jgi:hypothetical protein